jgi:hypothetical protein
MVLGVKLLGIESFPPLAGTIGFGQVAIVFLRRLQPCSGMRGMDRHTEGQTSLFTGIAPAFHQVLLWTVDH